MEAWKLKRNVAPMAITALLLLTADLAKVAFLWSEALV
jgi:hypothetical protein